MATSTRKRRICSYDMAEVPAECYCLEDAQAAVYFCSDRCLCLWAVLWATKTNLPEDRKRLDMDLVVPGGARVHFMGLRELARWAAEKALGRESAATS